MVKYFFVFITIFFSTSIYAYNMKKCFGFQTKGAWFRKYDFKYLAASTHPSDSVNVSVPTKTTFKEGLTKFSTENSTQGSTMATDPGVSTNLSPASTQHTSSFGPCSMLGKIEKDRRDAYIASNWETLRQEIAIGSGDQLATLAYLNGCYEQAYGSYVDSIRGEFDTYSTGPEFADQLDRIVYSSNVLSAYCALSTGV